MDIRQALKENENGIDVNEITTTDIENMTEKFIVYITYTYDSDEYDDEVGDEYAYTDDEYEAICEDIANTACCPISIPINEQTAQACGYYNGINQFDITAITKPITAKEVLKIKYSDDVYGTIKEIVEE